MIGGKRQISNCVDEQRGKSCKVVKEPDQGISHPGQRTKHANDKGSSD